MQKSYLYLFFTIILIFTNGCGNSTNILKTIMVYEDRGSVQCEIESGIDPNVSASKFTDFGVDVLKTECAFSKGIVTCAACGCPTTEIIIHTIEDNDTNLADAIDMGFTSVEKLIDGYEIIACK